MAGGGGKGSLLTIPGHSTYIPSEVRPSPLDSRLVFLDADKAFEGVHENSRPNMPRAKEARSAEASSSPQYTLFPKSMVQDCSDCKTLQRRCKLAHVSLDFPFISESRRPTCCPCPFYTVSWVTWKS